MICGFKITNQWGNYKYTIFFILIYILVIPFQKLLKFDCVEYKVQLTEIIFLLIAVSFIINTRVVDILKLCIKKNKIDLAVMFWFIVGFINLLVHQNITSLFEFIGQFYLIFFYFIIRIVLPSIGNVGEIRNLFISIFKLTGALIFIVVLVGLVLFLMGIDIGIIWKFKNYPYFGTLYRLKALTNEPAMLSSILSIILIGQIVSNIENEKTYLKNIFLNKELLMSMIFSGMLLFTFSKSLNCLFAAMIFIFFVKFTHKRITKYLLSILAVVTISSYLFMAHYIVTKDNNRYGEGYGLEYPLLEYKSYFIYKTWYLVQKENAIKLFRESPLFGVGGGNMVNIMKAEHQNNTNNIYNKSTYDPLSTYTGIIAEYGLLGLISLVFLIFSIFISFRHYPNAEPFRYIFLGTFSYFFLEAICTDIMNFRHFWIPLAFFSTVTSFYIENEFKDYNNTSI